MYPSYRRLKNPYRNLNLYQVLSLLRRLNLDFRCLNTHRRCQVLPGALPGCVYYNHLDADGKSGGKREEKELLFIIHIPL